MSSRPLHRPAPCILLGAFFWLLAALFVRFAGPETFQRDNPWLVALFLITAFVGWPFLRFAFLIVGADSRNALRPTALICTTGLLLDGAVLLNFPVLYGESSGHIMLGAAWLLWGVGCLLAWAIVMQVRAERRAEAADSIATPLDGKDGPE